MQCYILGLTRLPLKRSGAMSRQGEEPLVTRKDLEELIDGIKELEPRAKVPDTFREVGKPGRLAKRAS